MQFRGCGSRHKKLVWGQVYTRGIILSSANDEPQSADNEDGFGISDKTIGNLRCGNFLSGNAPCHEGWSKRQEVTAGRVV
jgi:hypothetical protein